jgi:hypothetical protein
MVLLFIQTIFDRDAKMNVYDIATIDYLETPSFAWREVIQSAIDEVQSSKFCLVKDTEIVVNGQHYKTFTWQVIHSGNQPFPGEVEERELIDAFRYLLVMQEVIPLRAIGEDWKGDLTISFGFIQD